MALPPSKCPPVGALSKLMDKLTITLPDVKSYPDPDLLELKYLVLDQCEARTKKRKVWIASLPVENEGMRVVLEHFHSKFGLEFSEEDLTNPVTIALIERFVNRVVPYAEVVEMDIPLGLEPYPHLTTDESGTYATLQYRNVKYKPTPVADEARLKTEMDSLAKDPRFLGRGRLILAPCGSGKTWYVSNLPRSDYVHFVDGDEYLEDAEIANKNMFWYDDHFTAERAAIVKAFDEAREKGLHILYSGNPLLMNPEIVIIPDEKKRWDRLQARSGWKPTQQQFDREQTAYEAAVKSVDISRTDLDQAFLGNPSKLDSIKFLPTIVRGDIPEFDRMVKLLRRDRA